MAMQMALGPFRFDLQTASYQTYKRNTAFRWPEIERIGRDPVLQFTGPKLDTIELAGVIYPHVWGGLGQMDHMRELGKQGKPLLLVDGLGRVHQHWVIMDIKEEVAVFFDRGVPRKISFTITLKRFGGEVRPLRPAQTPFFT